MDRRLFVTGLLGVVGTTGIATVLPRQTEALAAFPLGDPDPKPDTLVPRLPESGGPLGEVDDGWEADEGGELDEGFELAHFRRRRHWRRVCRWYWHHGHWHRRCRRRRFWIWIWI